MYLKSHEKKQEIGACSLSVTSTLYVIPVELGKCLARDLSKCTSGFRAVLMSSSYVLAESCCFYQRFPCSDCSLIA